MEQISESIVGHWKQGAGCIHWCSCWMWNHK